MKPTVLRHGPMKCLHTTLDHWIVRKSYQPEPVQQKCFCFSDGCLVHKKKKKKAMQILSGHSWNTREIALRWLCKWLLLVDGLQGCVISCLPQSLLFVLGALAAMLLPCIVCQNLSDSFFWDTMSKMSTVWGISRVVYLGTYGALNSCGAISNHLSRSDSNLSPYQCYSLLVV